MRQLPSISIAFLHAPILSMQRSESNFLSYCEKNSRSAILIHRRGWGQGLDK